MEDANCSQMSLNYSLLEMELEEHERSEINDSILDESDQDEQGKMEKIVSQEQLQDCKDERSPTQRLPVKMRLVGTRPKKTSNQEMLRVRAPFEDVGKQKFNVKRVCYSK